MARDEITVDAAQAGTRLDKLLCSLPSIPSREKARQALRSGKVEVDGVRVAAEDAGRVLGAGTRIRVLWNRPGTALRGTEDRERLYRAGLSVVHRDEAIVICNKPAGLLTDAADPRQAREETLRKRVSDWLGGIEVWPAHRIDRHTTGLVCFARSRSVHERLAAQWVQRTPLRRYLALAEGDVSAERGHWAHWMAWDAQQLLQRPASPGAPGAVLAEASWEVVERFPGRATLLAVQLSTGRRNQIRLHAMLARHPLVGEKLYREGNAGVVEFGRYALHAQVLGFTHPTTGEARRFEAPLPDDLRILLDGLRPSS